MQISFDISFGCGWGRTEVGISLYVFLLMHIYMGLCSRSAHFSIYDKNPDDQLPPGVVPDELIQPQSDKYWAPHPQTGVFGPAAEQNAATAGAGSRDGGFFSSPVNGGGESVLEEKAWFRPTSLEDLEKPH